MRAVGVVAAVGILLSNLSGCTTEQSGHPVAAPSGQPSATADSTYGAPRVAEPLDASRYFPRPCDVLTTTQLKALGITRKGTPYTTDAIAEQAGPYCIWHSAPELGNTIGIGFLTGNKAGLSDTYRGKDRFKFFEETTVGRYPAVFAEVEDSRASGICTVVVGISDTLTFRVTEQGGLKSHASCERARHIAAEVIATLKSEP